MGLLAFPREQREKYNTFKYFTNEQRWVEIHKLFLEEANNLFHLTKIPIIENSF